MKLRKIQLLLASIFYLSSVHGPPLNLGCASFKHATPSLFPPWFFSSAEKGIDNSLFSFLLCLLNIFSCSAEFSVVDFGMKFWSLSSIDLDTELILRRLQFLFALINLLVNLFHFAMIGKKKHHLFLVEGGVWPPLLKVNDDVIRLTTFVVFLKKKKERKMDKRKEKKSLSECASWALKSHHLIWGEVSTTNSEQP